MGSQRHEEAQTSNSDIFVDHQTTAQDPSGVDIECWPDAATRVPIIGISACSSLHQLRIPACYGLDTYVKNTGVQLPAVLGELLSIVLQ